MFLLLALLLSISLCSPPVLAEGELRGPIDTQLSPITPSSKLNIKDAIQTAVENYPAVFQQAAEVRAARQGISLEKTLYLPNIYTLYELLWSTRNKIDVAAVANIAAPVMMGTLDPVSMKPTENTVIGQIAMWEPTTFGYRHARVNEARAQFATANSRLVLTKLDVGTSAAQAFLQVVAAEQVVKADAEVVDAYKTFAKVVHVLVDHKLRAGADAAIADAQVAIVANQLIRARQNFEIARATLAQTLGVGGQTQGGKNLDLDLQPLLDLPPGLLPQKAYQPQFNPLAITEQSMIDVIRKQKKVIAHSYYPHADLFFGASGWGSGYTNTGAARSGGFGFRVPDYNFGLYLTFPVMDIFSVRLKYKIAKDQEVAQKAEYDVTIQKLIAQDASAEAMLKGSTEVAANTPLEIEAAREGDTKAVSRYKVGLASVAEVAEAQRILATAEQDNALARVDVWRSLLALAYANGDLKPFLDEVTQAMPAGK